MNNAMDRIKYIKKMKPPYKMTVIDIDITNRCGLLCSNCTRLIPYQNKTWDMSINNFEIALDSLEGYGGVVAIIGGNPCLHPEFEKICEVLRKKIPDINRRGLWTNHFHKHWKTALATFGVMNLNPHGDEECIKSLSIASDKFGYHEGFSRHAPILLRLRDFVKDEKKMWKLISRCDINQRWSASIIEFNGKLRAYFCEVAAALDLVLNLDKGIDVTQNWWRHEIEQYIDQIETFCPNCGVPLRINGPYDYEKTDYYSEFYENIVQKCRFKQRKTMKVESLDNYSKVNHVIDYSINAKIFRISNQYPVFKKIIPKTFRQFLKRSILKIKF